MHYEKSPVDADRPVGKPAGILRSVSQNLNGRKKKVTITVFLVI